jgi:hypothetical protein
MSIRANHWLDQRKNQIDMSLQTKQNKTKQNKTKQNKTKQNKTKQNKTKQNKTKRNKTKQNKTKQNKTKQNKAHKMKLKIGNSLPVERDSEGDPADPFTPPPL